jgi:hypothetical protein
VKCGYSDIVPSCVYRWSINPTSIQTPVYSHTYYVKILKGLALINVYSRRVTGPQLSFQALYREKLLVPSATSDIKTDLPAFNYCLCSMFTNCPLDLEANFFSCSLRTGRSVVARVPRGQLQSQPANFSENEVQLITMYSALCQEKPYQCLYLLRYDLYKESLYFNSDNR